MAKPTLTEVYQALGTLERAGMLEEMQMKRRIPGSSNRMTATETTNALNKPVRRKRKRRVMTEEDIDAAILLYNDQGMTAEAIGRELGFCGNSIRTNIGLV